jgi:preprotein translocase subunit YajC
MLPHVLSLLAATPAPGGPQEQPSLIPTFVMFGLLLAIIYFLILRPQRRAEQERQSMQGRVKKNDHVLMSCGMKGIVTSVKDDEVTLKVDESNNVRIVFTKSSIAAILSERGEGSSETGEKK